MEEYENMLIKGLLGSARQKTESFSIRSEQDARIAIWRFKGGLRQKGAVQC
jgi:hypothetical protein